MISVQATRSVDGVQRPQVGMANQVPRKQPIQSTLSAAQVQNSTPVRRPFQIAGKQHVKPTLRDRLQLPTLILGGMLVGFFVQSLIFGIAVILLYSALALTFRVPSRATFMLAFMALVTVMVLLLIKPGTELAGNFATYTFLLLVTGVIALAIEARPPKRRKRRKKPVRG